MENNLIISASPHIKTSRTVTGIMLDVIIALLPACVASAVLFGLRSLLIISVCVASCVVSEWLFSKAVKKPCRVNDLSACVTGILLALNLPASIPLWQAVIGSVFATVVVKGMFGGIGQNFANPAITARIMLVISFTTSMTAYTVPFTADLVTSATPIAILKGAEGTLPSLTDMLLGIRGGSLGETCTAALLAGGLYLIVRKVISPVTPLSFIGTVFVLGFLFDGGEFALYQVLSGGLVLGAFFMATDYSTTPTRPLGKLIFGVGCGLITCAIRFYGSYPEGVSFSILLMNIITPYIDKWTRYTPVGGAKQ